MCHVGQVGSFLTVAPSCKPKLAKRGKIAKPEVQNCENPFSYLTQPISSRVRLFRVGIVTIPTKEKH